MSDGRAYRTKLGDEIATGTTACISIRPEQVRLRKTQTPDALDVIVRNRIFLGEHTEYLVQHAQLGNIAVLAPRQAQEGLDAMNKGEVAWVHWDPDTAIILKND